MSHKFWKKGEYKIIKKKSLSDDFLKKHKKKILILSVILAAAGLFYLFFYVGFWRIKKITFSGTENGEIISSVEIILRQTMTDYRYGILPKNNFFILEANELEEKILADIDLAAIAIDKRFPATLKIEIEEKLPVLIWQEGNDYFYVDQEGLILKAIRPENIIYDLPMASYATTTAVIVGRKIADKGKIIFIKETAEQIAAKLKKIKLSKIIIAEENKHIYFYTTAGWFAIFSEKREIAEQVKYLNDFLEQKGQEANNLEYIDMRVPDRIYYK
jgi:cell division septal protein FtsQ